MSVSDKEEETTARRIMLALLGSDTNAYIDRPLGRRAACDLRDGIMLRIGIAYGLEISQREVEP